MFKKSKGFTLIELLAVILILAIVALITTPIVLKIITKSRKGAAKASGVSYLQTLENYMVMHKIDPIKYPFEFEPGKPYSVEQINKVIDMNGKLPSDGSVVIDSKNSISNAEIKIDGYDVVCKSSVDCEIGEKPVIHVIVPEGWNNQKEIEVIVVKPGIGLSKDPISYDGGNTWTDDKTKVLSGNSEIDIKVKDKNGKEVEDIYICTKKVDGHGENCHKIGEDDLTKGSGKSGGNSGKIIISDIDNVLPTCELEIKGENLEENWYNSDIEAKISKMDDKAKDYSGKLIEGSGIKSSNINYTKITTDGTYEIIGTVIDNAGNKGTCKKTVKRDTKKPTIEVTVDGTTRSDGYESGAKVVIKCTDETGKISYQTPDVILNGGGSKTVTATCKDNAGNEVTTTKTYNVYEYSSNSTCGYKSCENSACGTATGTRKTGGTHACGSYECGTTTCTGSVESTCYKTTKTCTAYGCVTRPPVYDEGDNTPSIKPSTPSGSGSKPTPGLPYNRDIPIRKLHCDYEPCTSWSEEQTPYSCTKTISYSCPKYCTEYCDNTETYTYNKTCSTAACGNQTCWHK